jgi:hypothetical protein
MRNLTNRLKSPVMFRRVMTVPLLSLSALLLVGGPAEAVPAVPHGMTLNPFETPCPDFTVLVEQTSNSLERTVLPNGVSVIAGPGIAKVTNLETGKSITYNISGPGTFDPATNRLSLKGLSLISNDPNVSGAQPPFLWVTSGNVGFIINQPIDQQLRGHILHDVCAELA